MTAMNECKLYHMIKDQLIKDHPWGPGPEGDYVEKNPTANQTITGEFDLKLVGNVAFNSTLLHPGRIELTDLLDEEGVTYRLTHYGGGFYLARGNAATNTETTIFSLSADGADFSKLGVTVDKIITTEIANDTEPEIDVVNTSVLKPAFRVQGDYEFTPFEQPNKVTNGEQYAIFQCKTYVPNPDDYNDDDVNDYQVVPKKWIVDHISGGQGYVTEEELEALVEELTEAFDETIAAIDTQIGHINARYPPSGKIPNLLFGFATTQDVDDPTDPDYLKRFATHKYVLEHLEDYVPYSVYTPAITGINEHVSLLDTRFPASGIIPIVAYGANAGQDTDPETDPNTMTKFATHQYVLDHTGGEGYLSLSHPTQTETVDGNTVINKIRLFKTETDNEVRFNQNSDQAIRVLTIIDNVQQYGTDIGGNYNMDSAHTLPYEIAQVPTAISIKANKLDRTHDYAYNLLRGSWVSNDRTSSTCAWSTIQAGEMSGDTASAKAHTRIITRRNMYGSQYQDRTIVMRVSAGEDSQIYVCDYRNTIFNKEALLFSSEQAYGPLPILEDDSYGVNVAMPEPLRVVYRRKVFQLSGDYFLTEGTWLQYDDFTERAMNIHETLLSDEDVKMLKEKNVTIDEFSEYRKLSPVEQERLTKFFNDIRENRVTAEA